MEDERTFNALAELCRIDYHGNYKKKEYSDAEIRMLCIDAIMYYRLHERQGDERIDINDFFKEKGL